MTKSSNLLLILDAEFRDVLRIRIRFRHYKERSLRFQHLNERLLRNVDFPDAFHSFFSFLLFLQ